MNIVLATNNKGKIKEFKEIINNTNINLVLQSEYNVPSVDETGTTFVENAIIKARNASKYTGLPSIADDSGLSVDCLNGQPGIYSSRYSGENTTDQENNRKLLENISKCENKLRTARYWCVIVFMKHYEDPTPIICQSSLEGIIVDKPKGTNGFGYDPLFYLPELDKTVAELPIEIKCKLSARGKCVRQIVEILNNIYK